MNQWIKLLLLLACVAFLRADASPQVTPIASSRASQQQNSAAFLVAALGKVNLVEAVVQGKVINWVSGKAYIDEKQSVRYDKNWADRHAQRTALHISAFNGHFEASKLLLENGWDPSARDQRDQTPGEIAYEKGYYNIAKLLGNDELKNKISQKFDNNAFVNATNDHNNALFIAVSRGDKKMVRAAIHSNKELEVDWEDNHQVGVTAGSKRRIFYSPTWSKISHPKDKMRGWSALHMAAFKNDLELIKDLIDAGWRRDQKNGQGQIPYEVADNWETKNVIEKHVKRNRAKPPQQGESDGSDKSDVVAEDTIEDTENNKLKKNLVKGVKIQPADVHEDDAKEIEAYLKKRKEMEEEERRDEEEMLNDASMPEDL